MKTNGRGSRNSIAFTPQLTKRNDSKSRRSVSSLNLDNSERSPNDTLFDTLMSDPMKRAMIMQIISQEKDNIERYKQKEDRKKVIKLKRIKNTERLLHCESPTALLRRRALETNRRNSDSSSTSTSTSDSQSIPMPAIPFERLLRGVVAYVEIRSKEGDRSAGAKALMQAMGAVVKDHFTTEVTHVIFKDGSFNTYQKAKLMKVHLVSILWLEAVRKFNTRVPEKNYPALGTEAFDVNITQICQDYEKVVHEEIRRSQAIGTPSTSFSEGIKSRKTALPSELKSIQETLHLPCPTTGGRLSEVIVPTSQNWEAESVISYGSGTLPYRRNNPSAQDDGSDRFAISTPEMTSDDDSECGVINGHSFKRDSSGFDLDKIDPPNEPLVENVNVPCIPGSSGVNNASVNTTNNTSSSRSASLLSRKSLPNRKSSYKVVDMDLTKNLLNENNFDKENINLKSRRQSSSMKSRSDSALLSGNFTNLLQKIPETISREAEDKWNKMLSSDCSLTDDANAKTLRRKSLFQDDKLFKEPYVNLNNEGRKFPSIENGSRISTDNSSVRSSSSNLRRFTCSTSDLIGKKQTQRKYSTSTDETPSLRFSTDSSKDATGKKNSSKITRISGEVVEVDSGQKNHQNKNNKGSSNSEEMPSLKISTSLSSNDASEGKKRRSKRISGEGVEKKDEEKPQSSNSEEIMSSLRISTSISSNDNSEKAKKMKKQDLKSSELCSTPWTSGEVVNALISDNIPLLRISTSISSNDNSEKTKKTKKPGLKSSEHCSTPRTSGEVVNSLISEDIPSLRISTSISSNDNSEKTKKTKKPGLKSSEHCSTPRTSGEVVNSLISKDIPSLRISTSISSNDNSEKTKKTKKPGLKSSEHCSTPRTSGEVVNALISDNIPLLRTSTSISSNDNSEKTKKTKKQGLKSSELCRTPWTSGEVVNALISDNIPLLRTSTSISSNDNSEKTKKTKKQGLKSSELCRTPWTSGEVVNALISDNIPLLRTSTSISSNDNSEKTKKTKKQGLKSSELCRTPWTSGEVINALISENIPSLRISTSTSSNDNSEKTKKMKKPDLKSSKHCSTPRTSGEVVNSLISEDMSPLRISTSCSNASEQMKTNLKPANRLSTRLGRKSDGSSNNEDGTSLEISNEPAEKKKRSLKSKEAEKDQTGKDNDEEKTKKSSRSSEGRNSQSSGSLISEDMPSLRISTGDSNDLVDKPKKKRTSKSSNGQNLNKDSNSSNNDGRTQTKVLTNIANNEDGPNNRDEEIADLELNKSKTRGSPHADLEETNKPKTRGSTRGSTNENSLNNDDDLPEGASKTSNRSSKRSRSKNSNESTSAMHSRSSTSFKSNDFSPLDESIVSGIISSLDSPKPQASTKPQVESHIPNKKQKLDNEQKNKKPKNPKEVDKGENKKFRKLYNLNQSVEETLKNFDWANDVENKDKDGPSSKPETVTKVTRKKPFVVPLTPISITPIAKKLIESRKKKVTKEDKEKDKTSKKEKENLNSKKEKEKTSKKEKEPPKPPKKVCLDSSKDEQKELTDEYVNKTRTSKRKLETDKKNQDNKRAAQISRRSQRLSQCRRPKYTADKSSHSDSESDSDNEEPIRPDLSRRSTFEFVQTSPKKTQKKAKRKKRPSIVCTRMHKPEVQTFMQIVKKLGCFFVEDEVSEKTTHLVVGEPKRTINFLRALARGCWILKQEWLFKSLEAEKWLPEEDYEVTEFSPSVQQCRTERQAFGSLYSMDIFENCGPIYIARSSIPRRSDLQELVKLCKGTVTNVAYNASVVVGEWVRYEDVACVTEIWILDSITFNKRKSFKNYLIKRDN